jgi:hypothetical protein
MTANIMRKAECGMESQNHVLAWLRTIRTLSCRKAGRRGGPMCPPPHCRNNVVGTRRAVSALASPYHNFIFNVF